MKKALKTVLFTVLVISWVLFTISTWRTARYINLYVDELPADTPAESIVEPHIEAWGTPHKITFIVPAGTEYYRAKTYRADNTVDPLDCSHVLRLEKDVILLPDGRTIRAEQLTHLWSNGRPHEVEVTWYSAFEPRRRFLNAFDTLAMFLAHYHDIIVVVLSVSAGAYLGVICSTAIDGREARRAQRRAAQDNYEDMGDYDA